MSCSGVPERDAAPLLITYCRLFCLSTSVIEAQQKELRSGILDYEVSIVNSACTVFTLTPSNGALDFLTFAIPVVLRVLWLASAL